jgi:RNA polymerase sigma factor (sigma-70 family)
LKADKPTVFLVDDDASVRDGLKWLLESVGWQVQAFPSAIEFLENYDPTLPGCLVLDVRMPGLSGLELQRILTTRKCGVPIIIITGHGDVPMCVRAFESGAFGFLEKPVDRQLLLEQVARAIEQDREHRQTTSDNIDLQPLLERLTPRERQVVDLLVEGRTMKQIAGQLRISVPTCSKHRSRALEKLEVENDVELVRLTLTGRP